MNITAGCTKSNHKNRNCAEVSGRLAATFFTL